MESFLEKIGDSWVAVIQCLYDSVFGLGQAEVLVVISVILLYQKKFRVLKNVTSYYFAMLMFLSLPFVGYFIKQHMTDFEGYYTGFFNLLPTNLLISATITYVIFEIDNKRVNITYIKRIFVLGITIVCIFFLGRSNYFGVAGEGKYENNMWYVRYIFTDSSGLQISNLQNVKVCNPQKVLDEVVSTVNVIRKASETPVIAAPFEYNIYIRQYSPECKIAFGRYDSFWNDDTMRMYQMGDVEIVGELLMKCEEKSVDYVVFPLASDNSYEGVIDIFEQKGWRYYAKDEDRLIFEYHR